MLGHNGDSIIRETNETSTPRQIYKNLRLFDLVGQTMDDSSDSMLRQISKNYSVLLDYNNERHNSSIYEKIVIADPPPYTLNLKFHFCHLATALKRLPRVIRVAINRAVYRGSRSRGKGKVLARRKTSRLTDARRRREESKNARRSVSSSPPLTLLKKVCAKVF